MQQWNAIYLVSYADQTTLDSFGDPVRTETRQKVWAKVRSIGQKEYYQAQTAGLKPELKFILATERDYQGQEELIYEGVRYKIQRTYINGDGIELTAYGGVRDEHTENGHEGS